MRPECLKRHNPRTPRAPFQGTIGVMKDTRHLSVVGDPKCSTGKSERGGEGRTAVDVDRAAAALAGRQHGMVARWQLLELGMTAEMIKIRLRHGSLHRFHRGVFAYGHTSITVESRWMAATLAFGPHAVLSHRSAAHFWGLLPRARIRPEVTRPTRARARSHLVVHRGSLLADEVVRRRGIAVTSVPRTMFDLAAVAPEREVERAWNEMEVREYRDPLSVPDLLARYPGRRGSLVLARLAARKDLPVGRTRNDFEEAFLALIDRHGLPRPRMNAHLALRGRFFEVDCLWEDRKVAIELDGGAVHMTKKAFDDDRERDRILTAERWTTTRVTWHHLDHTADQLAADLHQILTPYPLTDGSGALRPLPPR